MSLRLSYIGLSVLFHLRSKPDPTYGTEIMSALDLKSGTLYPLLARMEEEGILKAEWEKGNPRELGRPLHKYVSLTEQGKTLAQTVQHRLKL